jgi:hypothetical protein
VLDAGLERKAVQKSGSYFSSQEKGSPTAHPEGYYYVALTSPD